MQQRVNHTLANFVRILEYRGCRCPQSYQTLTVRESVPRYVRRRKDYGPLLGNRALFEQCSDKWSNATPHEPPPTRGCSGAEEHPQQPVPPIPLPPDRVREESGDSLALGVDRTRACCFNHGFRFPDYQARNLPQSSADTE